MEIKQITLTNIGPFKALELPLAPTEKHPSSNITIFVGNNGAGKTSILQALATSLSWFIARLRTEKGNGNPILEEAILNIAAAAFIAVKINPSRSPNHPDGEEPLQWTLAKNRAGRKAEYTTQLGDCNRLANHYRNALTHNPQTSLPLIAFYPVERTVLDIPLKIRTKHTFLQLDGYDNALSQGVDFRRFFEWFREREDSENESLISEDLLRQLRPQLKLSPDQWERINEFNASAKDRQLTAVRTSIHNSCPTWTT